MGSREKRYQEPRRKRIQEPPFSPQHHLMQCVKKNTIGKLSSRTLVQDILVESDQFHME